MARVDRAGAADEKIQLNTPFLADVCSTADRNQVDWRNLFAPSDGLIKKDNGVCGCVLINAMSAAASIVPCSQSGTRSESMWPPKNRASTNNGSLEPEGNDKELFGYFRLFL